MGGEDLSEQTTMQIVFLTKILGGSKLERNGKEKKEKNDDDWMTTTKPALSSTQSIAFN